MVILIAIATLVILDFIFKNCFCHMKLKTAPHPFPLWPVLGNLPLIGKLPYLSFYKLSQKYGDVMELKLGSISVVVISSPNHAKEVLQIHDLLFATRPRSVVIDMLTYGRKSVAWAPYGDHWRQMRKLCAVELFTTKRLQAFKKIRDDEFSYTMHEIFEHCKDEKPINMQALLHKTILNIITQMLFSKRYFTEDDFYNRKGKEFNDLMAKFMHIAGIFNISDYIPYLKPFDLQGLVPQAKHIFMEFDQFFDKIIHDHLNERQVDEPKDIVDVLLSLPAIEDFGDRLDDNRIKAILHDMLLAGVETSNTVIEWALVEILKNPKIMKKLQYELDHIVGHERVVDEDDIPQLKYLQAVVKETFRLHPPLPLLTPHESTQDCEVGGYHIPAKTRIIINAWAIHRHPSAYENPWDFNPERFIGSGIDVKGTHFQLLPFGCGRRMCVALPLGLTIVQLTLARLLHGFTWKLPIGEHPQDIDMGEVFGVTTPKAIPLQAIGIARLPFHIYTRG
ncbi:unnamed protein product [Sphagnum balticum]